MEPGDTVGRASAMATRVGGIRKIGLLDGTFSVSYENVSIFLRAICG